MNTKSKVQQDLSDVLELIYKYQDALWDLQMYSETAARETAARETAARLLIKLCGYDYIRSRDMLEKVFDDVMASQRENVG